MTSMPAVASRGASTARMWLLEGAVLAAMALVAGGAYAFADTARFNPPNATDPWIYTGAMWNLDYLYRFFGDTYYLSRLPWIIPGYLLNQILSTRESFIALHVAFALTAAVSGFLVARRVYGRTAAFAAFGALVTSLLFYDAYSTDYPDGAQITFLLVALAFAVFAYGGSRPRLKLALAGFFTAAAVCTNLFAGLLVAALALLYALLVSTGLRLDLRAWLTDAATFVGGMVVLVVACGGFALAHGGRFLFFMPSFHALPSISTSTSRPAGDAWVRAEPRLLVPLFLLAFVGVSWRPGGWRRDPGSRLAAGAFACLGLVSLVLGVWEFAGTGDFLYLAPYFRLLAVGFVLCTAAGVALLARRAGVGPDHAWPAVAVAAIVAGAAPTIWIYAYDHFGYVGRPAFVVVVGLMVATIAAAAVVRAAPGRIRRWLVPTIVALAVFGSNLAVAASSSTAVFTASTLPGPGGQTANLQAEGPEAMSLAGEFLAFMKANGMEQTRPAFWFDTHGGRSPANGLVSLYLYGYWTVSKALPTVDAAFRRRLQQLAPESLVLLCDQADCAGAPRALLDAGYRIRLLAGEYLHAGRLHLYARAYRLQRPGAA